MIRTEFRRHADAIVVHELRRAREGRPAVEDVSRSVARAVVEALLDDARGEPRLAAALISIYGSDSVPASTIAPCLVEAARRG